MGLKDWWRNVNTKTDAKSAELGSKVGSRLEDIAPKVGASIQDLGPKVEASLKDAGGKLKSMGSQAETDHTPAGNVEAGESNQGPPAT
jgi:hypothetical protein